MDYYFTAETVNGKPICSYTKIDSANYDGNTSLEFTAEEAASAVEEKVKYQPGMFPLRIALYHAPHGKLLGKYMVKRRVETSYLAFEVK